MYRRIYVNLIQEIKNIRKVNRNNEPIRLFKSSFTI